MGGLGYFFERAGVATTSISLIREHTETIRPPRALWTSFELGRPFGAPNRPGLQTRVLKAALALLEKEAGPVLVDFPEDAPSVSGDNLEAALDGLACPVDFGGPDQESPAEAFRREAAQLGDWHRLARERAGRTTFGLSGLSPEEVVEFLIDLADGRLPEKKNSGPDRHLVIRMAIDDLKAYYQEAALAKPGAEALSGDDLLNWFWGGTKAAGMLMKIRQVCLAAGDERLEIMARGLVVPRSQAHRITD